MSTYKAVSLKLNLPKNYYDLQTVHNDNVFELHMTKQTDTS